jgi:cell pole-organizing protein PopZ
MEDLLASIRRAINEDSAARAGHIARSQGFTGPMRELRPIEQRPSPPPERPQPELPELRSRRAEQSDRVHRGFADILSGQAVRRSGPDLRESYAEPDSDIGTDSETMDHDDTVSAEPARAEGEDLGPEQIPYHHLREARAGQGLAPADPQRHGPARTGMLSPEAAAGAEAAFSHLADTLISRAAGERSIEDITRELLRPMLKQWLDENLPAVVERLVREEIERVARRGGR